MSAASIAARTAAAVRPGRVAAMPARCAAAVASAARRSSATAASSCSEAQLDQRVGERRVEHVDARRGGSRGRAGGSARGRSRRRARRSVATARPRTLAGSRDERAHGAAGRLGDLVERRRRSLPERVVGLRLGQVEREGGAVVDRDRAAQRETEEIEEVAARAVRVEVRGVVARARQAGGDERRAVAEQRGQPRAPRARRRVARIADRTRRIAAV